MLKELTEDSLYNGFNKYFNLNTKKITSKVKNTYNSFIKKQTKYPIIF